MMRRSMLGAVLLGAFVLAATAAQAFEGAPLAQAPAEQVGMSTKKLERIREVLKREIEQGKLPGTVVMVARKGKLVYADAVGFQDKNAGKPMALDSIFRIYSMTKPLVSVAAMMLVEDGKIQLTDPVSKFLPAFKGQRVSVARADAEFARVTYTNVAAEREMTVQDLLRHTSGLAYGEITQNAPVKDAYAKAGVYLPGVRDYDSRDMTPAEQVERVGAAPLAHQPGTVWEYSLASDILGRVVEAASGQRLGEFLDERLFKPLRMADTAFSVPARQGAPAGATAGDRPRQRPADQGDRRVGAAEERFRRRRRRLDRGRLPALRPDAAQRRPARRRARPLAHHRRADDLRPPRHADRGAGRRRASSCSARRATASASASRCGSRPASPACPARPASSCGPAMPGTYFWVDPKEQVTAVFMSQAPSPIRAYYRKLVKQLVYQAIVD